MDTSFGDRHDETQIYVSSHKGELAMSNLSAMQRGIYFFAVIYFVFLIAAYVTAKSFELKPVYFLVPLVLLLFWKLGSVLRSRPDYSLESVRLLSYAFYMSLFLVVDIIDIGMPEQIHISFQPLCMAVVAFLYVDYFLVSLFFECSVFLEFIIICRLMGIPFSLENFLMGAVCACICAYGTWVLLGVYTDNADKEKALKMEGSTDLLTGLLNKVSFEKRAKAYLAGRNPDEGGGILFIIDFDNFKSVNDEHGHLVGDEILKKFGQILKKHFRDEDIVGRVGGDEFMVLLVGNMPEESLRQRCNSIEIALKTSKVGDAGNFSCSMGVVIDNAMYDFPALYKLADDALYEAKARGKAQAVRWHSRNVTEPEQKIIYIATPDEGLREKIQQKHGAGYIYMESGRVSEAFNEISLYEKYLEMIYFDYTMKDMEMAQIHKYMDSRPVFSQIPVYDVNLEIQS